MPKWTVIVEGREFPARPLVLESAGVPPNDPTNSYQAVAILEELGFETRYSGNSASRTKSDEGSVETPTGLAAVAEMFSALSSSVPKGEWAKVPGDLSKNVDHYLYDSGNKK
jgi:hypothetical protein